MFPFSAHLFFPVYPQVFIVCFDEFGKHRIHQETIIF